MRNDIGKILIDETKVKERIAQLGEQITKDYQGKQLILVGLLKGSMVFMSDLMRCIDLPLCIDFMEVSSYGRATKSSGIITVRKDLSVDIRGYHVLVVEDILDSGRTLSYITEYFKSKSPASVEICTLLDKPSRHEAEVEIKYLGFQIPDEFVVGFGLDYAEKYRNLPYIGVLKPEVYSRA